MKKLALAVNRLCDSINFFIGLFICYGSHSASTFKPRTVVIKSMCFAKHVFLMHGLKKNVLRPVYSAR
jgi:hypothetical protein